MLAAAVTPAWSHTGRLSTPGPENAILVLLWRFSELGVRLCLTHAAPETPATCLAPRHIHIIP